MEKLTKENLLAYPQQRAVVLSAELNPHPLTHC